MSTILLTNHNENIYNIIKKEDALQPPQIGAPSQRIAKLFKVEGKTHKHCHKTFGLAEVPLNKPMEYLKKNSRIIPPCPEIEQPRCLLSQRRPKIPPRTQATKKLNHDKDAADPSPCSFPKEGQKKEKEAKQHIQQNEGSIKEQRKNGHNYCYQNVIQAKKLVPRQPKRNFVDTKNGHSHTLQSSGLEPHHILRKTFGKIPNYLHRQQLQAEASQKETETSQFKPKGHYITGPEREALLKDLKRKWEELQKAYQLLPILTDTIPKIQHKIKLDEELKQLENDIKTIELHPDICVTDAACTTFNYKRDSD